MTSNAQGTPNPRHGVPALPLVTPYKFTNWPAVTHFGPEQCSRLAPPRRCLVLSRSLVGRRSGEGKPYAPEIFVFFKHIDSASMADAGPQLQKVLDFRRSLEDTRQVLYHGFANAAEFKAEVDRHLRAFAKGELPYARIGMPNEQRD